MRAFLLLAILALVCVPAIGCGSGTSDAPAPPTEAEKLVLGSGVGATDHWIGNPVTGGDHVLFALYGDMTGSFNAHNGAVTSLVGAGNTRTIWPCTWMELGNGDVQIDIAGIPKTIMLTNINVAADGLTFTGDLVDDAVMAYSMNFTKTTGDVTNP